MKLTCDLCGGELQVNAGGQGASCVNCGLGYTMERLREKLSGQVAQPVPAAPVTPVAPAAPVVPAEPVAPKLAETEFAAAQAAAAKVAEPAQPVAEPQPAAPQNKTDIADLYEQMEEFTLPEQRAPLDEPGENPVSAGFNFCPEQFILENSGSRGGDLAGYVRQGGIGRGDVVYINGDYTKPYRISCINDNAAACSVKQNMFAEITLDNCPRSVLAGAKTVTGDPNPTPNAYNYPGSVWEYFQELLKREFPGYEVRKYVSHPELKIPVSFMLYRADRPVLAIMLVGSGNGMERSQASRAKAVFAPMGVSCIHFYTDYRNDVSYVTEKVRTALR